MMSLIEAHAIRIARKTLEHAARKLALRELKLGILCKVEIKCR